jgi:mannosyltransferase
LEPNKKIILDDIIYTLQKNGGISVYWENVSKDIDFASVERCGRSRLASVGRYLNKNKSCDLFHSSYFRINKASKINITTVHDFIYEKFVSGLARCIHKSQKYRAIQNSDKIICVSRQTKRDLLTLYPEFIKKDISVVENGVSEEFFLDGNSSRIPGHGLYVGARGGYKNFESFLKSSSNTVLKHISLVGGGSLTVRERQNLEATGLEYSVFPNCSQIKLLELYRKCAFLIYPSSYEGFGIPILEAHASRIPVILLNATWARETSRGFGIFIDNLDTNSFKDAIRKVEIGDHYCLNSASDLARSRTWEHSREQHHQIYRDLLGAMT